jgi:predicted Rossmann fold nucleotide-binding protein DprA/Smf involved in DNA uptake
MLTHTTQAVLLLTAHFSKPAPGDPKPLTPTEWGRFALWLKEQGRTPEELLVGDPSRLLAGWADEKIPNERIGALLSRSSALALALEKWQRAGLWVVTRSDPDYPVRLKKLLKSTSPPVFFGCGDRQLLNRGGLTVVGSRNASEKDLDFAHKLGGKSAEAGCSVVSGGARGVDESAMLGALEREGTVIGVLADRLLRGATSSKYRAALMRKNLVLVSPFNPEAGFDVGNAMARNKYVYCLSDAAVVVHSGVKGGTWSGALENLAHGWVPLWVKPTDDGNSGNAHLVSKGARWLPGQVGDLDIRQLFVTPAQAVPPPRSDNLFGPHAKAIKTAVGEDQNKFEEGTSAETVAALENPAEVAEPPKSEAPEKAGAENNAAGNFAEEGTLNGEGEEWKACNKMTFYEFFLRRMEILTATKPKSVEQLLGGLDISKAQLTAWLKRATEEGKLKKTKAPVRYAWLTPAPKPKQTSIFKLPEKVPGSSNVT